MLWNDTSSVCVSVTDSYLHLQAETGVIKAAWLRQTETRRVLFSLTVMNNACMKCLKRMLMGCGKPVAGVWSTISRNYKLPLLCYCCHKNLVEKFRTTIRTLPVNFEAIFKFCTSLCLLHPKKQIKTIEKYLDKYFAYFAV